MPRANVTPARLDGALAAGRGKNTGGDAFQAKLGAVAEHTTAYVTITDPERRVEWANAAFCEKTGYRLEEIIGRRPSEFLRAEGNDPSAMRKLESTESAGKGITCEMLNRTKSGETFWVDLDIRPVHDDDGQLTGFVTIAIDISERKAAAERLLEASLMGQMLEESLNEIHILDAHTLNFLYANRGARENLGYTLEELREMTTADINVGLDLEELIERNRPLLTGEKKFRRIEGRYRRKDGSVYDVDIHVQLAPDDASRLVVFVLDITERKAVEERLREASQFGAMLEESVNEIYILSLSDLSFIDANRGACFNLGYSLDELKTMTIMDISPDLSLEQRRKIDALLKTAPTERVSFEARHLRKDGSTYDAEVYLQTVDGNADHLIVFVLDITERKRAEDQAKAARQSLMSAIETLPDGFVLYDADDRLVICNERYREIYAKSAPAIVEGARFEDILRYGLQHGQFADVDGREEDWLAKRLAAHRSLEGGVDQQLCDGRWIRVVERRTPDGGMVGLRIDITDQLESLARAERAEQRLIDAINALPAAFWLYDEDDRLVLFNDHYRNHFKDPSFLKKGIPYEAALRGGLRQNRRIDGPDHEKQLVDTILQARATGHTEREYRLVDGRWIRSYNDRTSDGGFVGFGIDITDARERQEKLEYAAKTDPLTGLANRRGLAAHLEEIARRADATTRIAFMHVDLDRFKSVNDAIGHDAGDHVLQYCASVLRKATRGDDMVARVGGDEFVVVCADAGTDADVGRLADRLVSRLAAPIPYGEKTCHTGASIGVAFWRPAHEPDVQRRLTDADIALQQSKVEGRGRFHFFEDAMRSRALLSAELAQDIYDGLVRDEFEPFLQPQYEIGGKRIVGFEALIRWHHPRLGLLAPADFMFAAEEANLMDSLDQRMLERSCALICELTAAGVPDPKVSINMSGTRLGDPKIVERIMATTGHYAVKPRQLVLEILETTLLEDRSAYVDENLRRLVDAGFALELDDFGTGHAAIANLRKYPLERIKIDRSLVAGIDRDVDLVMITSAITNLARSLGLKVLAEGVETEAELEMLRQIGCTCVQGYLFSHPMPIGLVLQHLRQREVDQTGSRAAG
jgi:diguanylate cyclase (GGDEF)-like protein/PAS domain S-box-containing protein